MRVSFSQFYNNDEGSFPFSHWFQKRLTSEVTALVAPSSLFTRKFGSDFEIGFFVSAKKAIPDNEIRGPGVYKRTKEVEYSIFLPFDTIGRADDVRREALQYLFRGIVTVLERLEIDTSRLLERQERLIQSICSDSTMFEESEEPMPRAKSVHAESLPVPTPDSVTSGCGEGRKTDHDPFNEPETAHARARELMPEDFFWDCADEEAPFGSDEGADAYQEFRNWRARNPKSNLVECLSWIMRGRLKKYTEALCSDKAITRDLNNPDKAFLADDYDSFTLDATVIATALGQLLDEGHIDNEVKSYVCVAITRQSHPKIVTSQWRAEILRKVRRVVDAA